MDLKSVKSIIEGLKSSSSSRVQETLLKTKNKITSNDDGIKLFRESGGLEYLLPHLRKPNEKILDLTLSVLGNCCLEEESSLQVGKLNIYSPLVTILNTVSRDSIVGRACRVIGNLAQKPSNAENLHNHGAVSALIKVIENRDKNTSYPTLTMAVRAIRQLWMIADKRSEMLSLNAVRCVAILLTAECEAVGVIKTSNPQIEIECFRKSQEELINGILKCIGYFTLHPTLQCAEQIQGDGRGYQCLVGLTKHFESLALKCLMNLCYISQCRPLLGIAGFVECIVSILRKISEVQWWPEGASRALTHLSGESVNRSRLRHCGGLSLLLNAARHDHTAMRGLLIYVFDHFSFQILIKEGLLNLLTDELSQYVTNMNFDHDNLENIEASTESTNVEPQCSSKQVTSDVKVQDEKSNLFTRRKGTLSTKNEDELKVIIERDNMIVGFVDDIYSDVSDSQSDDDNPQPRRKGTKRARSGSPKVVEKKWQLVKIASKDWAAGVYWEPKSPEWPSNLQASGSRSNMTPNCGSLLSPCSDNNQSGFSPDYRSTTSSKRARWDWSPDSNSSANASASSPHWTEYQWSPTNSASPVSPLSANDDSSDSEVSGRYSPVCSENEGDAVDVVTSQDPASEWNAAQVAYDLDELIMADDESVEDDESVDDETATECSSSIETETKTSRIACVLVLLFRVSHGVCSSYNNIREEQLPNNTLELLAGKDCLNALLDYVERCKKPLGRAAKILTIVLSNALCLMSILKNRLALRLHNMSVSSKHPPAKCQQCKQIVKFSGKLLNQLTVLAESSYGIGEISYQLLKGSPEMKQTLSITLPYIVRSERPLKKYFIDCNALNLLFTIIIESKEDIQDCVTALAKLATNIHVKDPKSLENRFKDKIYIEYDPILDNLTSDEIVTFVLDDSSTVKANKVFLCQNSDFFSAMFTGYFKEAAEKCVKLQNVSKPALEYLLTLLHCGINNPKNDVSIFPLANTLETNLEVLLLSDRFLFDKLKALLISAILQFALKPDTADKIYVWSLSEGMGFLCVESVAYLLTGKMCEMERARSFQSILNLEFKDQWLDDIKSILLRQLVKK